MKPFKMCSFLKINSVLKKSDRLTSKWQWHHLVSPGNDVTVTPSRPASCLHLPQPVFLLLQPDSQCEHTPSFQPTFIHFRPHSHCPLPPPLAYFRHAFIKAAVSNEPLWSRTKMIQFESQQLLCPCRNLHQELWTKRSSRLVCLWVQYKGSKGSKFGLVAAALKISDVRFLLTIYTPTFVLCQKLGNAMMR